MRRHEIKKRRMISAYKQTISEAILFKLNDSRIDGNSITITRVDINRELTIANVYFTSSAEININKTIKALYNASSFFLVLLKRKIKTKFLPDINFFYDKDLNQAESVVDLINQLNKKYAKSDSPLEN